MSFNQSTSDKNETRYRKTGRSASSNQQHRGYSPAYPKGTGATVSVTSVSPQVSGMVPARRGDVQNGAHNSKPQLHGGSDVPIASTAPQTAEASTPQRSSQIVPKPPTSQSVSVTSDTRKPTIPAKRPGDTSKGVAIQVGSISPGFMNGMLPHPMQPHGIIHQGQNLTFTPPMVLQIPQMGNLGISRASQCPQQQSRKFGGSRKTPVDIIHPDTPELSGTKSTISKGKKKRKEILLKKKRKEIVSKTGATDVTSDLYGAYKNPEEKKGIENTESIMTSIISKQVATDAPQQDAVGREKDAPVKAEPEDWEDAADISPPKLETSDTEEQVCGVDDLDKDGHEHGAKKYSRDFQLKFSEQFTELPEGFEVKSDTAEILDANVNAAPSIDYDSLPSPGRIVDRQGGAARLDRRGSGIMDYDRWNKGGAANFRTGQGPNFGVLRNPRAPTPVQQHVRGILPGPAHSVGHQGGMQINNSDADRWQRDTNFQPKGLMPSPHAPLQVMHKADRKYEVGKVSEEEQAKQRQLKAILNKLTPQNFEKLFEQVKAVNIENVTTLTGVTSQIFDKGVMEPTFCEMYANFCFYLAGELPGFSEDNEKITFKRLLLCKCQEEFERGEREQEEAYKANEEGQVKQSAEEEEEKGIKARRRTLGNIRLIGELYKKKMLTERIMHECIKKLLGQQQTPDEEDIEALCILMSTIGEMIDHPKAKEHMDAYFERMKSLSNNMKLSSRVRFMLKDAIDLRKNKWQQRSKVEGPKNIEEVHRDAAQNVPSENVLTEDRLRDMSLAAIREFYSARDEKEAALCIKDLNSPSFHPSMISLWVTDSFERKDAERDLLAKLLVNLTKTHDGTLSQSQLIKGFETVLSTLEDTVIDAPRAPEFLGLIFAKVILENVVSLNQISQLIHEDGEELAGNILGNVLEIIKSEKGDNGLNEVRTSSNLQLETF